MSLERLGRTRRWSARVELLDDAIGCYGLAVVDEKNGEKRSLLRAELRPSPVPVDLQGPQDSDLHVLPQRL